MEESKLREGIDLMGKAEKAVNKTSFFGKKTPDWDSARSLYESAATAFKTARAYDHAAEAYAKCAKAYKEQDSLYLAAKQLETGAQLLVQQAKKPMDGARLYREASNYYIAHGSADKGAEVLEKAARAVETVDVNLALELYNEACTTYESEDRLRNGVDTFVKTIGFLLRNKRITEAIDFSQRLSDAYYKLQNLPQFNRQALSTVILVLVSGDPVEANKRITRFSNTVMSFEGSDEAQTARGMIEAFNTSDEELLQQLQKAPLVKFLDNEVARAAQALRIARPKAKKQEQGSQQQAYPQQAMGQQGYPQQGYQPQGQQGGGGFSLVDDDEDDENELT
ncbi:hypothetical protein HDU76_006059 [Blyttiomyces sp. JEL0837]|nr:hypothetical protein HDU76_006059 [Blyttiomyces sp. JEL0837]